MDKLSIISGALFLAADLFAIASLWITDWIRSNVGGNVGYFKLRYKNHVFVVVSNGPKTSLSVSMIVIRKRLSIRKTKYIVFHDQ